MAHRKRLQRREAVAADVRRDMDRSQVLLHELQRREHGALGTAGAELRRSRRQGSVELVGDRLPPGVGLREPLPARIKRKLRRLGGEEFGQAAADDLDRVLARHRQQVLAVDPAADLVSPQRREDLLLDELRLPLLDHQHRALARAEIADLLGNERAHDVERQHRHERVAKGVGETVLLQCTNERVVEPAQHDDAEVVAAAGKRLVQTVHRR